MLRAAALLATGLLCQVALCQDPGTKTDPPVSPRNADTTPVATTARAMAREWLTKKGWMRGENPGGAFVAIGTASFNAKDADNSEVRSSAFQLAALNAKNELSEFLATKVATAVAANLRDGTVPTDDSGVPKDVVQLLAEGVRASGGDKTGVLNSTDFASAVTTISRAEVAGAAVSNTFESTDASGNGAFAVVMRFTAVSRMAAAAALGQGPAPRSKDLADAQDWIKGRSETELYQSYGASLFRTGGDEVCVVSFGQANVRGKSDNAFDAAARIAKVAAMGELRMFVGELLVSESLLSRRASIREMAAEGAAVDYFNARGFTQTIVARTQGLDFQGAKPIRDWEGQQASRAASAGVALMWSVSGADAANAIRRQMDALRASAGGSGRRDASPASQTPSGPPPASDRQLPPIKPGSSGPDKPEP